ncbi:MAG: IclR family transcriptional regulator [Fusobacteriaceae bacterium]|jgi:DNA-binding IclR family transcriptional regulator|nr:IclR family transcriptional regulator [Fusobacteriaceae bacterium]
MKMREKVPAIVKADKIFMYLHYNGYSSQSKIAQDLGISRASVNRLLHILTELKYLYFENKKYSLGEKFYFFSDKHEKYNLIKNISYPYLEKLSLKFKETFKVSVLDGNKIRTITTVESSDVVKVSVAENAIFPLHAGAASKLLICQLDNNKLDELLDKKLPKYTENTITDIEELKRQLLKISINKIAFDNMEHSNNLKAVAVPILSKTNKIIAAISCPFFCDELTEENEKLVVKEMRKIAGEIEKRLIDFENQPSK